MNDKIKILKNLSVTFDVGYSLMANMPIFLFLPIKTMLNLSLKFNILVLNHLCQVIFSISFTQNPQ
jgi:hypothetical protein